MASYKYYSDIRQSGFYQLFLYCLLTVAVMFAYELLPAKKMLVVPSNKIPHYIYADTNSSGEPMVYWTDYDGLGWECDIENDGQSHICGFNVYLGGGQGTTGMDLTSFKTINIDLKYTGDDQRLRFYIRNYEPGFSDINEMQTAKFNNVHVPITYVNDSLVLSLAEFSVAEWWVTTYKVPRDRALPDFRHAIAFGIDVSYPSTPGKHNFRLNHLELVGEWVSRENWYLGILIFWLCVIMLAGAVRLGRLKKKIRMEQQRLERLANQNSLLVKETDKYKKLSMLDPLTGLLNRQGLSDYIEEYFPKDTEKQVSMVIVDIDHFKKINDSVGHDGGDVVLKRVAELIKGHTRQTDQVARWGGEEFVLILPDTQIDDAFHIAEEMRALIATTSFEQFPELQVSISSGVGSSEGKIPFHQLFRRVDIALYQAKAQGRNRVIRASV
ncbi:GGDEF domain-containing protein [Cellvibrio sp. NN19]|uniref:GGDEF domain-containing protein n=1 Tax=Cellvibrio chitinivorans TaxID=3102792 RepID=UPI002B402841|nr:GGDEF domain-containing protein [Cellvibrio sp. NN19]